eukprot:3712512-Ditylum_brightwellii.AAC.1
MKEKAAKWITDTVKFKHRGAKVSTVTPAERVAKAVKELTSAACSEPTDGPPDYIEAVQQLRAVLLKEQQPTSEESARIMAKYEIPQQQLVTPKEPIPTNPIPSQHPALILCEMEKIKQPAIDEAPIIPIVVPQQYSLREKATRIINSIIFEESPNVQDAVGKPKHIGKYTEALKHLLVTEVYKAEMHAPPGMFAGSIIDPETGR